MFPRRLISIGWTANVIAVLACCGPDPVSLSDLDASQRAEDAGLDSDVTEVEDFCQVGAPNVVGKIHSPLLTEISGLAVSQQQPGVLWVHNDSGDGQHIYAINKKGELLATYLLLGASGADLEDVAIGPGPSLGSDYIYLADIGDNDKARPEVAVYRFAEPVIEDDGILQTGTTSLPTKFVLTYPDEQHFNAESLIIDPISKDLFVITKGEPKAFVFRLPTSSPSSSPPLELVATIDIAALGATSPDPTGADISKTGQSIVVRTATDAYIWARAPGTTIAEAFDSVPCAVPIASEIQGESIGFSESGSYYTISEGIEANVNRYDQIGKK